MRIGIVSQWYPPEPAFIPGGLADELAARGHEVRVLTGYPNYPAGRVYPGYRQRWRHTATAGGVSVRRVPAYASHGRSAAGRAAAYLSFAATSALAAPRFLRGVDALYVYHPPATAYAAARRLGVPTVLHVQDMWPESVTASAMTPDGRAGAALHRALGAGMRSIYRAAAQVAVIAPAMADLVVERGADPAKVRVVLNWTDESLFRPVPATDAARAELGHRGRCLILFAGNIGPFQRVETAVRAAAATPGVDLVLVGSGTDEAPARALADALGATNVRFLGRRAATEMAALYAAADFQLVILRDLPALRGTVPSKLQAALACGSPVIVSAAGDCATLVASAGAGLTCPPEDWAALADRFAVVACMTPQARAAMGARARTLYAERMSLRVGADQIEDMLTKAAACPA
ncbi:glycosyltransferase family 4 protein [Luedemannella helvata]|uniref:Glycosyltransferase family 4 protein n=1 Tax=Luedemannella helvata TaxID=349315 RepID=A0ABN2L4J6_9ACTN